MLTWHHTDAIFFRNPREEVGVTMVICELFFSCSIQYHIMVPSMMILLGEEPVECVHICGLPLPRGNVGRNRPPEDFWSNLPISSIGWSAIPAYLHGAVTATHGRILHVEHHSNCHSNICGHWGAPPPYHQILNRRGETPYSEEELPPVRQPDLQIFFSAMTRITASSVGAFVINAAPWGPPLYQPWGLFPI